MRAWREKWGAWKGLERAWKELGKVLERKTVVLVYAWTRGRGQLESLRDSKLRNFEAEEFQHFEVLNSPRLRASKLRSFEASNRAHLLWLRQVQASELRSFKVPKLQSFEVSKLQSLRRYRCLGTSIPHLSDKSGVHVRFR